MGLRSLDAAAVNALLSSPGRTATSLVGEAGGRIVAFAGFYRTPESRDRAEVAFAVADALQGHGLGTRMLERLARSWPRRRRAPLRRRTSSATTSR